MSGNASLVLNIRGEARICLPADLRQITPYVLIEQEDWFEDEIRFARRCLRRGMRAIDVGANYGVYTMAMAQAVGRDGKVWAFEPTPATADFLQRTLELNGCGQVALNRAAVSDRDGSVMLSLKGRPEVNSIVSAATSSHAIVTVPAVTLSQAAREENWGDIDFVKLDVEGHELAAVSGGLEFFDGNSPLLMFEIKSSDQFDLRPLEPLAAMGYEFYILIPGLLVLAPFDASEPMDGYQLNLFACKRARAQRLAAEGLLVEAHDRSQRRPADESWTAYLGTAAYAKELAGGWRTGAGPGGDARTYLRGLAAFAESRNTSHGAAERYGWLHHAMECVEEAVSSTGNPLWRISYARLAREIGWRQSAVEALWQAANALDDMTELALAGPFLAPSRRFEGLATGTRPGDWMRCAVIEQLEKLRAYSSMFISDGNSLELLAPILDFPFRSPEMDRRCQLVRMAAGLQSAPEPGPLLCQRTDENLNPEFWCHSSRA